MADPYLGEIRMFAGNFAPLGWALCNGQLLGINDNQALFALLGTTYGGDGVSTFAVPDLQGRVPIHPNSTYSIGAKGGTETVTLTTNNLPSHTHVTYASTTIAAQATPNAQVWAASTNDAYSSGGATPVNMSSKAITGVGGSQPHDNMMPSLTISFIIALQGVYPPQS